jgi:uncharacterized membrane protein YfcA
MSQPPRAVPGDQETLPRGIPARALTLGIGFGAGLLNGLLGVGGGILIVPGLIFLRKLSPRSAVATSLGTVLVLSAIAVSMHLLISGLTFSAGGSGILLLAGAVGSQGGGYLLKRLPPRWILLLFSALSLLMSLHLIAQGLGWTPAGVAGGREPPLWSFPVIGFVAGLFSGMLGIGGGGLVVLAFATLFHRSILGGLPLALAVNLVNALSGVVAQRRTALTRWREVIGLVPSALVGIGVGVALAVTMAPGLLKIVFAVFFLYMGGRLLLKGRKGSG